MRILPAAGDLSVHVCFIYPSSDHVGRLQRLLISNSAFLLAHTSLETSYEEASDLVYSANQFHFYRGLDLDAVHGALYPRHAANITSVQLIINPWSKDWHRPAQTSGILSLMKRLRHLTVLITNQRFQVRSEAWQPEFEHKFLSLLKLLRDDIPVKVLVCDSIQASSRIRTILETSGICIKWTFALTKADGTL